MLLVKYRNFHDWKFNSVWAQNNVFPMCPVQQPAICGHWPCDGMRGFETKHRTFSSSAIRLNWNRNWSSSIDNVQMLGCSGLIIRHSGVSAPSLFLCEFWTKNCPWSVLYTGSIRPVYFIVRKKRHWHLVVSSLQNWYQVHCTAAALAKVKWNSCLQLELNMNILSEIPLIKPESYWSFQNWKILFWYI